MEQLDKQPTLASKLIELHKKTFKPYKKLMNSLSNYPYSQVNCTHNSQRILKLSVRSAVRECEDCGKIFY